jgi:hypothetical protein
MNLINFDGYERNTGKNEWKIFQTRTTRRIVGSKWDGIAGYRRNIAVPIDILAEIVWNNSHISHMPLLHRIIYSSP